MATLQTLITTHGVDVLDHLDREVDVPVLTGMQRQGDVLVLPRESVTARAPIPAGGVPVVRGENGGNTHALVGSGFCDTWSADVSNLTLGTLVVPVGESAYLAHPEHGYLGIGPGVYELRRQREQADVTRMVAD